MGYGAVGHLQHSPPGRRIRKLRRARVCYDQYRRDSGVTDAGTPWDAAGTISVRRNKNELSPDEGGKA